MADDDVLAASCLQHVSGQLAGVSAGSLEVNVLSAQLDVGALDGLGNSGEADSGSADDDVAGGVLNERDQFGL